MQRLDLQDSRCPLALVLLKQKLREMPSKEGLEVAFNNAQAMQDIILFLQKKNFSFQRYSNLIVVINH